MAIDLLEYAGKVPWETFDTECVSSALGDDYIGETSQTVSGIPCQEWAEQWPHAHSYDDIRYTRISNAMHSPAHGHPCQY